MYYELYEFMYILTSALFLRLRKHKNSKLSRQGILKDESTVLDEGWTDVHMSSRHMLFQLFHKYLD